jgi:hypothetical protein
VEKRERLTEAEQRSFEAEMKAAGIRVVTGGLIFVWRVGRAIDPCLA